MSECNKKNDIIKFVGMSQGNLFGESEKSDPRKATLTLNDIETRPDFRNQLLSMPDEKRIFKVCFSFFFSWGA